MENRVGDAWTVRRLISTSSLPEPPRPPAVFVRSQRLSTQHGTGSLACPVVGAWSGVRALDTVASAPPSRSHRPQVSALETSPSRRSGEPEVSSPPSCGGVWVARLAGRDLESNIAAGGARRARGCIGMYEWCPSTGTTV
ncbi:hypothetical protein OH76DRAFT_1231502 [Lentinus brumalis]|uniref:Uncharacterized protein n=1 Tax=Lentinus brumalis TaxID=2498619 RepID=A0A371CSF0_9APHY|nr:hypothetical protein OH76DRAFT_1231502 [Polyporus brumalis]